MGIIAWIALGLSTGLLAYHLVSSRGNRRSVRSGSGRSLRRAYR